MNSLAKKISLTGLLLVLNACAHHPAQYGYYPDNASYGSGYTVMERNYYDGSPDHYKGYDSGREFFRHHDHDQRHDSHRWGQIYPAPRNQHFPGENRHDHDAYQSPRQEFNHQRHNDYRGHPEPERHEHMKNWEGRQFDQHGENQNRRHHQEDRGMHNRADERGQSGHGGFNRQFEPQPENQSRRPHQEDRAMHNRADERGQPGRGGFNRQFEPQPENQSRRPHQEDRAMHNRADDRGGDSGRERGANRWRNQQMDNGTIAPATRARFLHRKNGMDKLQE